MYYSRKRNKGWFLKKKQNFDVSTYDTRSNKKNKQNQSLNHLKSKCVCIVCSTKKEPPLTLVKYTTVNNKVFPFIPRHITHLSFSGLHWKSPGFHWHHAHTWIRSSSHYTTFYQSYHFIIIYLILIGLGVLSREMARNLLKKKTFPQCNLITSESFHKN